MQHEQTDQQQTNVGSSPRKTYSPPRLSEHGTIQELALTTGGGPIDDGAAAYS